MTVEKGMSLVCLFLLFERDSIKDVIGKSIGARPNWKIHIDNGIFKVDV